MTKKLRAAVIGVGYLGRFHAQKYAALGAANAGVELVGVVDAYPDTAQRVAAELGVAAFTDYHELLGAHPAVDLVSVASTTETHHAVARDCLAAGVHVLAEKPITVTVAQADELIALADAKRLVLQVGHLERFNPAWLAVRDKIKRPVFIEAHRMAPFKARGIDVSVVLDLMIHDLDLILHLIKSTVTKVSASGVAVLSHTPDIANARIEFANGAVANLTASRISLKQMRKMRIFQPDHYLSLDFLEKNAQIVRLFEQDAADLPPQDQLMEFETNLGKKWLQLQMPETAPVNAIQRELETFHDAIQQNIDPVVTLKDGAEALKLAHRILKEIAVGQDQYLRKGLMG